MRLQPVLAPHPQYRGVADTHQLRRIDPHRSPTARQVLLNRRQSSLGIPSAPASDLHTTEAELRGNRFVVQSIRSAQHDLRTAGQSDADRLGSRPLRQLRTLFTQEHAYRRYTHRLIPTDGPNGRTINDRISSAKYEALH